MNPTRFLIVNADDFGLSEGVNHGIIEAHENGIVTSASLMVLKPAACSAATYGRHHLSLDLGLHLDLGEWTFNGESWIPVYLVVPLDDTAAVAQAISHQLSEFRRLVGRDPTHIDSHQHLHQEEPVRSVALELARSLDLPLRHLCPEIQYCGRFYGQTARGCPLPEAITLNSLIAILADLPAGITELGCHPGRAAGEVSTYGEERSTEVDVLSNPTVRPILRELSIELRSFRDVIRHGS